MRTHCRTLWQQKWLKLDATAPGVQLMADKCQEFAFRWFLHQDGAHKLVLAGDTGRGKTHCAKAIARWSDAVRMPAWEHGHWKAGPPSTLYAPWAEIVDTFKEGEYQAMQDLCSVSLLIIDDLGAEHDPSRNAVSKLCQVLNRREKLYTLVTTNILPEHWSKRFDIRVADRLVRDSEIVELRQTPSYTAQ